MISLLKTICLDPGFIPQVINKKKKKRIIYYFQKEIKDKSWDEVRKILCFIFLILNYFQKIGN